PSLNDPRAWAQVDILDFDTSLVNILPEDDDAGEALFAPNPGSFKLSMSKPSSTNTTVNLAYGPSGLALGPLATGGVDYAVPLTVTIPAGQTELIVPMTVLDDFVREDTENAYVRVQSSASGDPDISVRQFTPFPGLTINAQAFIPILDNDSPIIVPFFRFGGGEDDDDDGRKRGGVRDLPKSR
ncbi:MAG: hypothetical protein AAF656_02815, partial [Planctomycetota bacterium]